MARARNIKPGFFRNADLVELPMEARLLFIGLWMLADREGRLADRPKQIKMEIFPADNVDCTPLLDGLEGFGFIKRYVAAGKSCIQVINFSTHQAPHGTEKDSDLPNESGLFTIHKRGKNGCITGESCLQTTLSADSAALIPVVPVVPPLSNVVPPLDNALNPDVLNPESRILIPDVLNPDSKTRAAASETVLGQPNPARAFPDQTFDELGDIPGNPDRLDEVTTATSSPSMAAAVCIAIKAAGIAAVNPSHPDLVTLLASGADIGAFVYAAHDAVKKGKGFNYLLGAVKGQMADAKNIAERAGVAARAPNKQEVLEASNRAVLEEFLAKDLHAA